MKRCIHRFQIEAGCDEAGRGPLAGPVVGAAVILPKYFRHQYLRDSKQLSEKKLLAIQPFIKKRAIAWGIGVVSPAEIDRINILNASILAIHRGLDNLQLLPEQIAMDGNQFKAYKDVPHTCIVKGDAKFKHIAAASILAKTARDEIMLTLHKEFPMYGWNKNKGYPTKTHREAIKKYGPCKYHRKSFQLLPVIQHKLFASK